VRRNKTLNSIIHHVVCAVAILAFSTLYYGSIIRTQNAIIGWFDSPSHVYKCWLVAFGLRSGQIPFLWDSSWYAGYPFLQCYSPLFYYLGAPFFLAGLRFHFAFNIFIFIIIFSIGLLIYAASTLLFRDALSGLVSAFIVLASPFFAGRLFIGVYPFLFSSAFTPLILVLYITSKDTSFTGKHTLIIAGLIAIQILIHLQSVIFSVMAMIVCSVLQPLLSPNRDLPMKSMEADGEVRGAYQAPSYFIFLIAERLAQFGKILLLFVTFTFWWVFPYLTYVRNIIVPSPSWFLGAGRPDLIKLVDRTSVSTVWDLTSYMGASFIFLMILSLTIFIVMYIKRPSDSRLLGIRLCLVISGLLFTWYIFFDEIAGSFFGRIVELSSLFSDRIAMCAIMIISLPIGYLISQISFLYRNNLRSKFHRSIRYVILISIVALLLWDTYPVTRIIFPHPWLDQPVVGVPVPYEVGDFFQKMDSSYFRVLSGYGGFATHHALLPALHKHEDLNGFLYQFIISKEGLDTLNLEITNGRFENAIPLLNLFNIKYIIAFPNSNLKNSLKSRKYFERTIEGEVEIYKVLPCDPNYLRPTKLILYIGDEQNFHRAARALSLVGGVSICRGDKQYLSDYSLAEMLRYDCIVVSTGAIGNPFTARSLIEHYAESGGVVILDAVEASDFMGYNMYFTTSSGNVTEGYDVWFDENDPLFSGVNITEFAPAQWITWPWRYIAFNTTENVRMKVDGNPVLIFSRRGKGVIIGLGFNLLGHIDYHRSVAEVKLLKNLLKDLWEDDADDALVYEHVEKTFFGQANVKLEVDNKRPRWFLISESYFDGWRVYVNGSATDIVKVWPNFMVIRLQKGKGYFLVVRYEPTIIHYVGGIVSLGGTSLILFISYLRSKNSRGFPKNSGHSTAKIHNTN